MKEDGNFTFVPLDTKQHDRSSFTCGDPSLDSYLKTQASQDVRKGFSACIVAATQEGHVAGYYTLCAYSVSVRDLPESMQRKMPYPSIPSILLGRLAVKERCKGKGLGSALLADALTRACRAEIPAYAMVVHALNANAISFYLHEGFEQFPSAPNQLFLPLATIRKHIKGSETAS